MAQTKRKRMTVREKKERAQVRKQLQKEGILPPDKKRLNRSRFASEVRADWEAEQPPDWYLRMACILLGPSTGFPVSSEQVGVLKVMKAAVEIHRFEKKRKEHGETTYPVGDLYEQVILPIKKL